METAGQTVTPPEGWTISDQGSVGWARICEGCAKTSDSVHLWFGQLRDEVRITGAYCSKECAEGLWKKHCVHRLRNERTMI